MTVSILLKDAATEKVRARKRNATAKRRSILRLASNMRLQKKPTKKSVLAAPPPSRFQMWPVLLPYDICKSIHAAGLEKELWLGSNIRVVEVFRILKIIS